MGSNLNDAMKKEDPKKTIKVESLNTLNFGKIFADHDETLLYIYYTMPEKEVQQKSFNELSKRGWLFNESDQTWYVTRNSPGKGGKSNKPKSHQSLRNEENIEQKRYKFDIDQWNLVEIDSSSGDV